MHTFLRKRENKIRNLTLKSPFKNSTIYRTGSSTQVTVIIKYLIAFKHFQPWNTVFEFKTRIFIITRDPFRNVWALSTSNNKEQWRSERSFHKIDKQTKRHAYNYMKVIIISLKNIYFSNYLVPCSNKFRCTKYPLLILIERLKWMQYIVEYIFLIQYSVQKWLLINSRVFNF